MNKVNPWISIRIISNDCCRLTKFWLISRGDLDAQHVKLNTLFVAIKTVDISLLPPNGNILMDAMRFDTQGTQ